MKTLFILFTIFSIQIFAQYTTPDTGVNWNLDDLVTNSGGVVAGAFPNYTITNKINISASDRVYINPGTTVLFSGSTSGFEINGKFSAVGTITDSIIFSSLTQDSIGGAYNGFYFRDSSIDTACIISYARIEYAYYGLRCSGAGPTLSNSYLWKCRRAVYIQTGSNPVVSHNKIERTYEYGIYVTTGSSPLIEWNELVNNNTQNTSPKNQITIGTQGDNSPTILHNTIHGGMFNKTGGISISTLIGGSASSSEIAYNEIYNNSYGITMTGSNPITCYVHDNLIYNNNINPDVMVAGSGINIYGTAVVTPIITRNTIYGNWWGVTIQVGITGQPAANPNLGNLENADTTDNGQNIIYGNIQGSDVFDLYNNTPDPIYAQNNDWRVYDSTLIEDHIVHGVDSVTLGIVKFVPFSTQIPVELTSFAANVIDGSVLLNWTTATELNNLGFEIQKSPSPTPSLREGALEQFNWQPIGFVNGNGTSTEINNYTFTDLNPLEGKSFYRLKQIDFDGTFEYSNIIEVDFSLPIGFSLEQNYPNPFNPTTTIKYSVPNVTLSPDKSGINSVEGSRVQLKIYDVLGNEVATLINEEKPAGNYEIRFDASSLASGVYFYKLQSGSFIETRKMILLR
ncbi:MAG TPA: right-handed parallel beta-helix repeat-containing protein [Ignavibacteriaceae bacterium]|nr:right-handed parallel beta-helix repeat-containing protein [Ignavibacteriaceae bacterium]